MPAHGFKLGESVHSNVRELRRALGTPTRELSRQELADLVAASHPNRRPNATTIGRWEEDTEPDYWSSLVMADLAGVSFFSFTLPTESVLRERIRRLRHSLTANIMNRVDEVMFRIAPEKRAEVGPLLAKLANTVRDAASTATTVEQLEQLKAEWKEVRQAVLERWGIKDDPLMAASERISAIGRAAEPPDVRQSEGGDPVPRPGARSRSGKSA